MEEEEQKFDWDYDDYDCKDPVRNRNLAAQVRIAIPPKDQSILSRDHKVVYQLLSTQAHQKGMSKPNNWMDY